MQELLVSIGYSQKVIICFFQARDIYMYVCRHVHKILSQMYTHNTRTRLHSLIPVMEDYNVNINCVYEELQELRQNGGRLSTKTRDALVS